LQFQWQKALFSITAGLKKVSPIKRGTDGHPTGNSNVAADQEMLISVEL